MEATVNWFHETFIRLSLMGFEALSPMANKEELRIERPYESHGYTELPQVTDHAIFERDRWMVTQCDILFLDLSDTEKVSIGCMMELAWASLLGKHTVVVLPKDNVHTHAFVLEGADVIFETYDEAMVYMKKLF